MKRTRLDPAPSSEEDTNSNAIFSLIPMEYLEKINFLHYICHSYTKSIFDKIYFTFKFYLVLTFNW